MRDDATNSLRDLAPTLGASTPMGRWSSRTRAEEGPVLSPVVRGPFYYYPFRGPRSAGSHVAPWAPCRIDSFARSLSSERGPTSGPSSERGPLRLLRIGCTSSYSLPRAARKVPAPNWPCGGTHPCVSLRDTDMGLQLRCRCSLRVSRARKFFFANSATVEGEGGRKLIVCCNFLISSRQMITLVFRRVGWKASTMSFRV